MQTVFEEEESGRQFTDFMTVSTMRNFTKRKAMKPETMCRLAHVTEYFIINLAAFGLWSGSV